MLKGAEKQNKAHKTALKYEKLHKCAKTKALHNAYKNKVLHTHNTHKRRKEEMNCEKSANKKHNFVSAVQ